MKSLKTSDLRSWIEIDSEALRSNCLIFQKILGKDRALFVLKANAYGHGLKETYISLKDLELPWLSVNYPDEALTLRQLDFRGRILLVGSLLPQDLAHCVSLHAEPVLGAPELLKAWIHLSERPKAHIKFDTGMSRQGFLPHEARLIAEKVLEKKSDIAGICSHFANVEDVLEHAYAAKQLSRFHEVRAIFLSLGFNSLSHIASSAASLILEESRFDLCRTGISLYGFWPTHLTRLSFLQKFGYIPELKPALSWRARITALKDVVSGQFIGYGCTYRAERDMQIAVIPVGYYDGLPRLVGSSSASHVLIKGQRCRIVGRLCMNMLMADVSHVKGLSVGSLVTLIGKDASEEILASEVADWGQTIHYEIVTRLNQGIPRILL